MSKCENPDDPCRRKSARIVDLPGGKKLRVCKRCFARYENHGDGRKLEPWEKKKGRVPEVMNG